jgi:hypothetical protein
MSEREIVFTVREFPGGWVVEDGVTIGPYFSKARALDLAEGMALAIRDTGQAARVIIA